ncbi:Transient receptor potential cation channel trpm [Armadillidium nasatum]|uniref:Transient receptor potential cation channel trpm n=1 Tax=Armadillidium nasatum TaxID=96803 RepID=A0A5N5SIH8_9CRUS|nr:Transient receptor potential cation channel trpm [Armadillidium nasatum]
MQLVKKKDLITVFRLKEGSELDQSILSALLYSKCLSPPEQLSLALTWNRVDIARSHVFNEDVVWPQGSLEQAMMDALVNDRIEFVKLLIEQGVSMKKFLTIERLEELYNSNQGPVNTLRYIIKDIKKTVPRDYKYSLIDIGLAINKLMGGAFRSSYTRKKFRSTFANLKPPVSVNNGNLVFANTKLDFMMRGSYLNPQKEVNHPPVFEYPFSELLVWAVLTKRQQLSLLMWKHGEEAVAKALVAAKLYKALAHEGVDDDLETEVYEELKHYAKEYETLALDLLDYCYQQDEDRANQLLTYELKNWSKKTCLALAVAVNHRAFLSHPCCQILLADLWLGGLRTRKSTNVKVILGLIFPPLILFLGFRSNEELRSMPQTCEEHWEEGQNRLSDSEADSDSDSENLDQRNEHDPEPMEDQKDFRQTILELEEDLVLNAKVPLFNSSSSHHQANSTPLISPPHRRSSSGCDIDHTISKSSTSTLHDNCGTANFPLSPGIDATFMESVSKELPFRTKIYEFYNAPITKFWAYSGAFLVFLCIFTYVVLVKLPAYPEWPEWYVLAYISTFLLEKLREILSSEPTKLRQKLEVWSEKLWNVFDVILSLLFIFAFILRLQDGKVRDAGRVLEILSANKYLGPLVMMMGKMIKNMAYFVILLLVVLMAFGVCRQSILFPNEEPNWILARHIFYQPYFMLYGEVFAGDIDPPCGGPGEIECQPGHWITPTVMSMYLLVANILLINLLIAVFNNIFTSVNAISHQVWMFQRFQVVMEFEEKPVFPPPLIVVSHLHRAFKYFYYKSWKRKPFIYGHGLKRFLAGENLERVHDFEEECVDAYLSEKEHKEHMSTEERVRVISERTEALTQRMEETHSKIVLALASVNNLDFHIKRLQEDIQESNNNYAVLHRFMMSHVGTPHRSSGSGTPTSGHATPRSASQQSLQRMLEDSQKKMKSRASGHDEREDRNEEREKETETEKEKEKVETIRGRHGSLVVKMSLSETTKIQHSEKKEERKNGKKRKKSSVKKKEKTKDDKMTKSGDSKRKSKVCSPSRVSFRRVPPQIEIETETEEENLSYRRSLSQPEERSSIPKYDRSSSTCGSRPRIQVIPPSSPPPIITFTAEYTSLADELETVCMARLTPPASPALLVSRSTHLRPRPRHRSDSSAPYDVYYNPLRDAEEADYHLMEGIIQRRLHRDSENLAVSLEELCSIFSEASEDEGADRKREEEKIVSNSGRPHSSRGRPSLACLEIPEIGSRTANSESSLNNLSIHPSGRRNLYGGITYPLGSPTHNLQRVEYDDISWSPPVATLATPERVSLRSGSLQNVPISVQQTTIVSSSLLQVSLPQEECEGDSVHYVVNETEC